MILSDEGAKKQLNEFVRRIKAGEATFAQLATQYSQDPGSAAQDGELGYQTPDLYVPEFKHQVETLPVGSISEPFKTVHGNRGSIWRRHDKKRVLSNANRHFKIESYCR